MHNPRTPPPAEHDTQRNPVLARRIELAERFLAGDGIEIGALHAPLPVPAKARVRYVDRLDAAGLREHYPELASLALTVVDILDDGESLDSIEDGSLDFIIANHMLEHCENPLGAIRNHFRKIREGGVLYYALPDMRFSFDSKRPLTPMSHFVDDDRLGPAQSRDGHFDEWVRLVDGVTDGQAARDAAQRLKRIDYSIHFHVWDFDSFLYFVDLIREHNAGLEFDWSHIELNHNEIISVFTEL